MTYPLLFVTKRESSFRMIRVVLYLGGELAYGIFFVRGSVYILRDVVRILCTFLFFIFSYIILLYTGLVTILLLTYIVLIFIYMIMYVVFHLSLHVLFLFLSLYTCFFMYAIFIFVLH